MKKIQLVRELAIIKNHLYQIVSNPRFYDIKEPALTKLRYIYDKVTALYDALTGVED
jgi:hypothetical protein